MKVFGATCATNGEQYDMTGDQGGQDLVPCSFLFQAPVENEPQRGGITDTRINGATD